jgi:hypothetical protein
MLRHMLTTAAIVAAVFVAASLATAAPRSAPRSGEKACREALNGLVSMLDAKMDDTANYRDTYAAVVDTCGPVAAITRPKAAPMSRDACHDLAAAMVDLIEDEKMNSAAFVKARSDFALACPPR